MDTSVIAQVGALQRMTVGELQAEWLRLNGEPTRSRNRTYLWRRLAWRLQERRLGGLSDRAKSRVAELAPDIYPRGRAPAGVIERAEVATVEPRRPTRDPRLPSPGTVITRQYHGSEVRVLTLHDGFEWEGRRYGSLSAVARAVTGQHWNGRLFFGLTERKRKA